MDEVTTAQEVGILGNAIGDENGKRYRMIEILRHASEHTMLVTDLIKECSTDPNFYMERQTANFHLLTMEKAGIVEISDITLPTKTQRGRIKTQMQVRLLWDIKVFKKDLR